MCLLSSKASSILLGLATGGTAEMLLTAKIVGADAALVAAYQLTRGLLANLLNLNPIVSMDADGRTVVLDEALWRTQFGVPAT